MTDEEKQKKLDEFHKSEETTDFSDDPWNADSIRKVAEKILKRIETR